MGGFTRYFFINVPYTYIHAHIHIYRSHKHTHTHTHACSVMRYDAEYSVPVTTHGSSPVDLYLSLARKVSHGADLDDQITPNQMLTYLLTYLHEQIQRHTKRAFYLFYLFSISFSLSATMMVLPVLISFHFILFIPRHSLFIYGHRKENKPPVRRQ